MAAYFLPAQLDSGINNKMAALNDVWLYIHTNMIIWSYAVIGLACVPALLLLRARVAAPQISAGSSRPSRLHPTRASQVVGRATGGGAATPGTETPGRQPRNQEPDDAGSTRAARGSARPPFFRCSSALLST